MLAVSIAAIALVFVLLLYLNGQFHIALAMLLTTLSAVAAVFVGLWVTHTGVKHHPHDRYDDGYRHCH